MNITDVPDCEDIPEDIWLEIWRKQTGLIEKYKSIEERNGLGYGLVKNVPFSIDDTRYQYLIKDFAWRVTEELSESIEVFRGGNIDSDHFWEEVIDALHFLVELNVLVKSVYFPDLYSTESYASIKVISAKNIDYELSALNSQSYIINLQLVTYHLGLACNTLKNKPWKVDQKITDSTKFYNELSQANTVLVLILMERFTEPEIYNLYFRKQEVNKFRIKSKY